MFVIMSEDRKCVVKGKSKKTLCGMNETTRKELISYDTAQNAHAALKRMSLLKSAVAEALYDDAMPKLEVVETPDGRCF